MARYRDVRGHHHVEQLVAAGQVVLLAGPLQALLLPLPASPARPVEASLVDEQPLVHHQASHHPLDL